MNISVKIQCGKCGRKFVIDSRFGSKVLACPNCEQKCERGDLLGPLHNMLREADRFDDKDIGFSVVKIGLS